MWGGTALRANAVKGPIMTERCPRAALSGVPYKRFRRPIETTPGTEEGT